MANNDVNVTSLVTETMGAVNAQKEAVRKTRADAITTLNILMTELEAGIEVKTRELGDMRQKLAATQKAICKIQGHTYSDWVMHDGQIDRTWYYDCQCEVCRHKKSTENEPAEYAAQQARQKREREAAIKGPVVPKK